MAVLFILLFGAATSSLIPVFDFNVSAVLEPGREDWLVMYTNSSRADFLSLQEDFKEAAEHPKTQKAKYVVIDCAVNRTVCETHNVTILPEIKYIYNGQSHDYEWEWTWDGFYRIGHKLSNPASYSLQRKVIYDHFKTSYDFSFISWFYPLVPDAEHIAKGELIDKIAEDYRHLPIYFGKAAEASLRTADGIRFSEMPVVKQYGNDEVFGFKLNSFNETSLRLFIAEHKWGMMPPLNTSLWKAVHRDAKERGKILLLVFHHGSSYQEFGDYLNNLRLLQWDFRKNEDYRFQMASIDVEKYPHLAQKYNVTDVPSVLTVDLRTNVTHVSRGLFNPASKLETIRFMFDVWRGKNDSQEIETPAEKTEERHSITRWEVCLVVSLLCFLGWGLQPETGRKRKTA